LRISAQEHHDAKANVFLGFAEMLFDVRLREGQGYRFTLQLTGPGEYPGDRVS